MTKAEAIAYLNANVACALIEAQGMTAENHQRAQLGEAAAYTEVEFVRLIDKYGIHHNAIMSLYEEATDD